MLANLTYDINGKYRGDKSKKLIRTVTVDLNLDYKGVDKSISKTMHFHIHSQQQLIYRNQLKTSHKISFEKSNVINYIKFQQNIVRYKQGANYNRCINDGESLETCIYKCCNKMQLDQNLTLDQVVLVYKNERKYHDKTFYDIRDLGDKYES